MAYDNTNTGALFVNDKKETANHPDSKGQINVEGKEYWISAWRKESKDGKKYLSLSVTPKDAAKVAPVKRNPQDMSDLRDDIPF